MAVADHRTEDAERLMTFADEQIVVAAAKLAEATSDSEEYQRALYHYTQLVRHRMANPLQIIGGIAATLTPARPRACGPIEMLESSTKQTKILERVCLDPKIMHPSEQSLDPAPCARGHRAAIARRVGKRPLAQPLPTPSRGRVRRAYGGRIHTTRVHPPRRRCGARRTVPLIARRDAFPRTAVAQTAPLEQHIDPGSHRHGQRRRDRGARALPRDPHRPSTSRRAGRCSPRATSSPRARAHRGGARRRTSGLLVTVGWGLPYFRASAAAARRTAFPCLPAGRLPGVAPLGRRVPVLVDAMRFPSDPDATVLEHNDVVVMLRSDVRSNVTTARERLVARLRGVLEPTSIRAGFVGGGLPKRLATAAGIPGADAIPDDAQLFLGFTSTQRSALGPTRIANLESLARHDRPVAERLLQARDGDAPLASVRGSRGWYRGDYLFRVWATFRPGIAPPEGTQTIPEDASVVQTEQQVLDGFAKWGSSGTAPRSSRCRVSRRRRRQLRRALRGGDGARPARRLQHARQPIRLDVRQADRPVEADPAAGLHFVSFTATASIFEHVRRAMDGHYPDRHGPGSHRTMRSSGFNSVLRTTHRQNFLGATASSPLVSARELALDLLRRW